MSDPNANQNGEHTAAAEAETEEEAAAILIAEADFVHNQASVNASPTELAFQDVILPPSQASEMVRDLDKVLSHMSHERELHAQELSQASEDGYVESVGAVSRSNEDGSEAQDAPTFESAPLLTRSLSEPDMQALMYPGLTPSRIDVPGGFRRNFVGKEFAPGRYLGWLAQMYDNSMLYYDSEDEDDDSSDEEDHEEGIETGVLAANDGSFLAQTRARAAKRRLERRRVSLRGGRAVVDDSERLSSTGKAGLTIFKAFVATGVLMLPKGTQSAGLVAGTTTLLMCGSLCLISMLLLLTARKNYEEAVAKGWMALEGYEAPVTASRRSPGFQATAPVATTPLLSEEGAEQQQQQQYRPRRATRVQTKKKLKLLTLPSMARAAYGDIGAYVVNASIICSQLGFCCVYLVFTGNVLSGAVNSLGLFGPGSIDITPPPTWAYTLGGSLVIAPLCLLRHLKYFALPNLIANAFVVLSLGYIATYASWYALTQPLMAWDCEPDPITLNAPACFMINSASFLSFFGTSVYTFEGTALVIPIQNSMKRPEDLPKLLAISVPLVTLLFAVFGSLNFYAFRADTEGIIIANLPGSGQVIVGIMMVIVAIFMYPLMLFPATKIVERALFDKERRSGRKWGKNIVRISTVIFTLCISIAAESSINDLVAFIGALFCVPMVLVFPPLLYIAMAHHNRKLNTWTGTVPCVCMLLLGFFCMVVATQSAIVQWTASSAAAGGGEM